MLCPASETGNKISLTKLTKRPGTLIAVVICALVKGSNLRSVYHSPDYLGRCSYGGKNNNLVISIDGFLVVSPNNNYVCPVGHCDLALCLPSDSKLLQAYSSLLNIGYLAPCRDPN